jgi:hypothetical protein
MDITYGVGSALDGWHVDMVVHLFGWPIICLNVMITDGKHCTQSLMRCMAVVLPPPSHALH